MGDSLLGGQLPHFWLIDFFVTFPLNFYQKPIKYVMDYSFSNFSRKKIQKYFVGVGSRDLGKCGSWPPIKLSPSFQYVNFENYTSTESIFGKINNIHRYADKNLSEKK